MRLVFMLEEPSMKRFLQGFVPRFFPGVDFLCVEHEGKSDLEASLPRKLRAWNVPGDKFVVMRDSDGSPAGVVEARLSRLCRQAGRPDVAVCVPYQELEAWYLGDIPSLAAEYNVNLNTYIGRATFRNPDQIGSPSNLVKQMVPGFQKLDGARRLGLRLDPLNNVSPSFVTTSQQVSLAVNL